MSADQTARLNDLLGRSSEALQERERTLWDQRVAEDAPLVLFGAGGLGRKILAGLRKLGRNVVGFADNDPQRQGSTIDDVPVFSLPQAAEKFGSTGTFINAVFMDADWLTFCRRRTELRGLGCKQVEPFYPLFWRYPKLFLPHYTFDLPHKVIASHEAIHTVWDLLTDDISRRELLAQIAWRLDPAFDALPPKAVTEIYFPPELITLRADEVFIDCGAYNGDTLRSVLRQSGERFKAVHAFEPDPRNFANLLEVIRHLPEEVALRIKPAQVAIGRVSGSVHMNAQGAASSAVVEAGELVVPCEPLDRILGDDAATFIKMDVEGAEMDLLHGAVTQISRHAPLLAISVYHLQEHLWEIPLFVRSICPDYRFYLRRYSPVAFDDLVLFAIPPARQI